mgnify:CR=1 FL=1
MFIDLLLSMRPLTNEREKDRESVSVDAHACVGAEQVLAVIIDT